MSRNFEPVQDIISPYAKSKLNNDFKYLFENVNTQGKTIQHLVAEGQLTPGQYSELIRTVNGLISKGKIELDDLSEEVLNTLKEADPTFNLLSIPRDNSVTPGKTTFIKESTNLLSLENMTENKTFNNDGIGLSDSDTRSITDHIYIEKNSRLTFVGVYGFVQYDDVGNVISRNFLEAWSEPATRLMDYRTRSIRVEVFKEKINEARINDGDVLLPYENYKHQLKEVIKLPDLEDNTVGENNIISGAVTPGKTSFIEFSKNMLDINKLIPGFTISGTTGEKTPSNSNGVIEFIPVAPNTEYTAMTARYALYDAERRFIVSYVGLITNPTTFETTDETAFVSIVVHHTITEPMMNEGENLLPYTPYHKPRLSNEIEVSGNTGGGNNQTPISDTKNFDKFTIAGKLDGFYEQSQLPARGTGANAQTMIDNYDVHVNSHPHYVSREKITESVTGHSIYLYDFNPDIVNNETSVSDPAITKFPTIFIVCGTHGTERMSPLVTNHFFNQLVNNWQENELLETLRWGVRFKVIPMLNPDGWNSDTRQNANGVDLNRQFPTGWIGGTPGTSTYGGTAPLTEPEAIAVNEILENEEDLIYFCDFHNFSSSGISFLWNAGATKLNNNLAKSHISQMVRKWKKKYDWMPQDETSIMGYSSGTPNGSMAAHGANLGIQSSTFETGMAVPNDPEGETYSSNTMTLATEAFINWILLNVKNNIDL